MDLSVSIGKIRLKNPITCASGTAGYGEELSTYFDCARLGALFTKGLSLRPRPGNSGPRILETPSGVLNSIGLENVGMESFVRDKLPPLLKAGVTVIPNIAGHSIEENVELCRIVSATEGIEALELNVSCPNVKEGGIAFGTNVPVFTRLLESVRKATDKAIIVKLSPNVADITQFASIARDCGMDAVSVINTLLRMKIDIHRGRPHFVNRVAGLSGPAIRPIAVRMVYEIFARVNIPIIGLGGIATVEDALEFMMAGASAVSIGTMNMVEPAISMRLIDGLIEYGDRSGIAAISEIVGRAHQTE